MNKMKICQFYKKLNATELGKMGTNETYISVPRETNLNDIFSEYEEPHTFKDMENGKKYNLILRAVGNEYRVTGLGPFYRNNDVNPGDKVRLERKVDGDQESHIISTSQSTATFVLQLYSQHGFRIINDADPEILGENNIYDVNYQGEVGTIQLKFLKNARPRSNSRQSYDYFDLIINGESVRSDFRNHDIIEILIDYSTCLLVNNPLYQKQTITY